MRPFAIAAVVFTLVVAPCTAMGQPPGPPPGGGGTGGRQQVPGPAGGGGGRQQGMPARGAPPREAPRGTSILRGVVVAADNGNPIRRAQVRVAGQGAGSRLATTDAQGRFEIRDLPAGRYTLSAAKGGFVSLQYGQRRPSESGTPLELGDAQVMD